VVGIDCLAAQGGDEGGDLAAVVPGVAAHLGEDALDVPAPAFAGGAAELEGAGELGIVKAGGGGGPGPPGGPEAGGEFVEGRGGHVPRFWGGVVVAQAREPDLAGGDEVGGLGQGAGEIGVGAAGL